MKKHNFLGILSFFLLAFNSFIFMNSCKTVPSGTHVRPLDLLGNSYDFYMTVPSNCDEQLIKRIILNNVQNISESDAKMISERVKTVYLGLNRHYSDMDLYASIDSAVPVKLVSKILSKKNGWDISEFSPEGSPINYSVYSNGDLKLSFPASDITCLGMDISPMLEKYDAIHSIPLDESSLDDDQNYSELPLDLYEWLNGAQNEIRFYSGKPQAFLYMLIGASLDLKLNSVKGTFIVDDNFPSQYILNLDFKFKNEKFLKAGKVLLAMTFGLTNSQANSLSSTDLSITGIKIDKEQLYKLLVI